MTQTTELLFVYGTLKRDQQRRLHPLLRPFCRYVGTATVQGRLYDLGRYPGLVLSADSADCIHGELYQIVTPAKAWPRLDTYEECDPDDQRAEYRRQQLTVRTSDGKDTSAWCYVYNRKTTGLRRIIDGNYRNKHHVNVRIAPSPSG